MPNHPITITYYVNAIWRPLTLQERETMREARSRCTRCSAEPQYLARYAHVTSTGAKPYERLFCSSHFSLWHRQATRVRRTTPKKDRHMRGVGGAKQVPGICRRVDDGLRSRGFKGGN